jgi:AI-2 transport protein TqsA
LDAYPKGPDRRVSSNILLTIITILLVGVLLRLARTVIIPVLIAMFLAYVMDPLVAVLRRMRVPLILGILIAAVLFMGAFLSFTYIVYQSALDFARAIPRYQTGFVNMIRALFNRVQLATGALFGVNIPDELRKIPIGSVVLSTLGSLASLLSQFLLVFFFSLLLLAGKYGATRKLLRSFPRKEAKKIALALLRIDGDLRKYVGIKAFVSLLVGVCSGLILALFRVDFVILIGFLTFVLNFVPYLGSTLAVLLPVVMALVQFASWPTALWLLLVLVVVQNLIAQLLEPKLVGARLQISFPVVFFTLFFWGWLWGAPGVLLAVPMTTSLKIVMEDIPGTRPFARLLERVPRRRR